MDLKYLKTFNKEPYKLVLVIILLACISVLFFFHSINEKKINQTYYEDLYFDKKMADKNRQATLRGTNELEDEKQQALELLADEASSEKKIAVFNSFQSNDQLIFLQNEIDSINSMDWVALEEANYIDRNMNIEKYTSGKKAVNDYLMKHKLKLKSVKYSTDSAIFTMNVLEFLSTPLFFVLFFLLCSTDCFKKFEDGRIKFLLTLPLPRMKIIAADFITYMKKISFVFIVSILYALIGSFLISQEMTLNYPIVITFMGVTKVVPLLIYLLLLSFSFFLVSIFIFIVTYLIALLSKKMMLTIFLSFFICFGLNFWLNFQPNPVQALNPFTYINTSAILKGNKKSDEINFVITTGDSLENGSAVEISHVLENESYYANSSLAMKAKIIDIVLLPVVLLATCIILFLCNYYLLNNYKV